MAIISSVVLVVAAYESILVPEAREYGLFSSIASAVCAALETDSNLTSTLTSLVYVEVRNAQPSNLPQERSTRTFMISRCSAIPLTSL